MSDNPSSGGSSRRNSTYITRQETFGTKNPENPSRFERLLEREMTSIDKTYRIKDAVFGDRETKRKSDEYAGQTKKHINTSDLGDTINRDHTERVVKHQNYGAHRQIGAFTNKQADRFVPASNFYSDKNIDAHGTDQGSNLLHGHDSQWTKNEKGKWEKKVVEQTKNADQSTTVRR